MYFFYTVYIIEFKGLYLKFTVYHGIWWEFLARALIVGSHALIVGFHALIVIAARGLYILAYTFICFHITGIYCHIPGIFCHIRLYTVYLGLSQVHTWHIYLYTTYMTGLFPCYVIWRNQPYVCCHISVIYIYWKTLLQSISSQYSLHDGITRFMDRASEDFRLWGFLGHLSIKIPSYT